MYVKEDQKCQCQVLLISCFSSFFVTYRYSIGNKQLPYFTVWAQEKLNVDLDSKRDIQELPKTYPEPILSAELFDVIKQSGIEYSIEGTDRLVRAHGHTLREIYMLKHGTYQRIPDIILWPSKYFSFCSKKKKILFLIL